MGTANQQKCGERQGGRETIAGELKILKRRNRGEDPRIWDREKGDDGFYEIVCVNSNVQGKKLCTSWV